MATTLFRGPVLQGKWNRAGVTGYNLNEKTAAYAVLNADSGSTFTSPDLAVKVEPLFAFVTV